jgi:hypothetical protein
MSFLVIFWKRKKCANFYAVSFVCILEVSLINSIEEKGVCKLSVFTFELYYVLQSLVTNIQFNSSLHNKYKLKQPSFW